MALEFFPPDYIPQQGDQATPVLPPEGSGVPTDVFGLPMERGIPAPSPISAPVPAPTSVSEAIGETGSPGELVSGLARGLQYGIPGQIADTAQFLGVGGQTARDISEWSKAGMAESSGSIMAQTGEMIPASAGVQLALSTIGRGLIMTGNPMTVAVGGAMLAASPFITPLLFGGQQAQQTKETAIAAGVAPGTAPLKTGGIEILGESLANWSMGRVLGPLAAIGKVSKAIAAKVGVTSALKGTVGSFLKELGLVTLPTEISTEMLQNYAEAQVEKSAGIRPQAQPGMEAISAVAPTGLMTVLMASLGIPIRNHMINKQAQILSTPVPDTAIRNDPTYNPENWKALRFSVAEQVDKVIPVEFKPAWKKYYTDQITNNLPIDISTPIPELGIEKPIIKPTPAVTKKEGIIEEVGQATDLSLIMGVATKLSNKKTKGNIGLDDIETLLNIKGKHETLANDYLDIILDGYNEKDLATLKAAYPELEARLTAVAAPGKKPEVIKPTVPGVTPIVPTILTDTELSPENQTVLQKLIAALPAKEPVVETGEVVGPRLHPELSLEEQRKKIILATKGTREKPIAPISMPLKEFLTYSHPNINLNEISKKNPDGTVSRFTVEGFNTAKVGKKDLVKSVLVRPAMNLPEGEPGEKRFGNAPMRLKSLEEMEEEFLLTEKAVPKLTFTKIINDKNPPGTQDELIAFIAKKKAEGLDVTDIVTDFKKPDYLSKYLAAIHKAVDNKIKGEVKRIDLKGEKIYKPTPTLSDITKALHYEKKEGEAKPYVLEHQDDTGKMVPTIHDTLTEAEEHAKKLNTKYAVRGTIQKSQENRYDVGEIRINEEGKISDKGEPKWVVTSKQIDWKTIEEKGTKQARRKNIYLTKAYEIFDTKLKNDISNSLEFIKDVLLPYVKASLKKYKFTTYKVKPTTEQSEYFVDNPPGWVEKQHHALADLHDRLQEAVDLNFIKPKTELIRGVDEKLQGKIAREIKLARTGEMNPDVLDAYKLKPVDELVFNKKDLEPFFRPGEMEGAILPALTASEDGWAALNHFDAHHNVTKLSKEQIEEEERAAKVRAELKKLEGPLKEEEIVKPEPKKTAKELKAKEAAKKKRIEAKSEEVRILREIEEVIKNKTLLDLVSKAFNSKLIEEMGPPVVRKVAEVISPVGRAALDQLREENQERLEENVARRPRLSFGPMKSKPAADKYKAYLAEIAKANKFLFERKQLLGTTTDLSEMTKEDIPNLLKIWDLHKEIAGKRAGAKEIEEIREELGYAASHEANTAQIRDLLGMQEEGKVETGITATTRKKQEKLKTAKLKTGLEKLIAEQAADLKSFSPMAKKVSKEKEIESIVVLTKDLDLSRQEVTGKEAATMSEEEAQGMVDEYGELAEGDVHEMAMDSIHVVSEYVAKTRPSSTYQEFKLSMHEFLGKTWNRIKTLAKYLWNRIGFMRGAVPANTEPMNMSVEGENRRIPRRLLKDIPALYVEIKKRAKNKAVEFNSAYRATGDEGLKVAADMFSKFSAFNVTNESQNRKDFNNTFEPVLKAIYPAISKETLTKLRSHATQRGLLKLGTVEQSMIQITGRLKENGTVESALKSRKEAVKKFLSPWMLSPPEDTTYTKAIRYITEAFRNMPRNFRNAITLSDNWMLVNDNPSTRYIARRITPAFKAAFDADISRISGVAFTIDTAISNPGAFTGPIKVMAINHPFNPNSAPIPTRIVEVGGSIFTLRMINGKWHFIFPNVAEMFTPGNVEMLKSIDKADYEGRELAETKGMSLETISAGEQRIPNLLAQKEINRNILMAMAKNGEVTTENIIRSTDIGYIKAIINNDNKLPTGKDFEGNDIISASKFIPGGEIPMYGGKGGDHVIMIGKISSLEGPGNGVNDWNIKPEISAKTFGYIYHGKTYNYEEIKAEVKTTKAEQITVTKEYLQKRLPKATITQLDDKGNSFRVEFPGGAWFDMENIKKIENEELGVTLWANWKITSGKGKMKISDISKLADEERNRLTRMPKGIPRSEVRLEHEIFHMVTDYFMTKEEQAMMLSAFAEKGDVGDQTWERIAKEYEKFAVRPYISTPSNLQNTWLGKLQENIKQLIFLVKGLIFGDPATRYRTPDSLFAAIHNGEITTRAPQLNLVGTNSKFYLKSLEKGALPTIVKGKLYNPNQKSRQRMINASGDPMFMSLASFANNPFIEAELPYSPTVITKLKDFIYRDKEASYKLGLTRSMKLYEQVLSNPMWKASATMIDKRGNLLSNPKYGQRVQKYPEWAAAVQIERDRFHKNSKNSMEYIKATETFHRLKIEQIHTIDPIFEWGTTIGNRYLTEEQLRTPSKIKEIYEAVGYKSTNYTLSNDTIKGYLEITNYMSNVMFPKLIAHTEESMIKSYVNTLSSREYAELQRLYTSLVNGHIPKDLEATLKRPEFTVKNPLTGRNQNKLAAAYKNLNSKLSGIRAERAKIGFGKGYMPLRREPSSHYVSVMYKNKDGNEILIENFSAHGEAMGLRIIEDLESRFPEFKDKEKYRVFVGSSSKPTDSTFFMIGDMNTARIIDLAISKLTANDNNSEPTLTIDQAHDLADSIYSAVSDIMKARGAGVSAIQRNLARYNDKDRQVIKGYIKEDFRKIIDGYVNGYHGMQSKFDAALEYMNVLKDLKAGLPSMYAQISKYAQNNLRNTDKIDRALGKIKGFMFYWYLAGKMSMVILQETQNFVTGVPLMAVKMKHLGIKGWGYLPEIIMGKAMFDSVTMKSATVAETEMINYFKERGDTMAQYLKSIEIESMATGSRFANNLLKYLAWPMKATEEHNRRAALLAYYRVLTQQGKMTDKNKIYKECEDFMYQSHWWYSKANAPTLAHGPDAFSRMANLAYTFRPFTHNYVLSLAYAFTNYGGIGGLLYAGRSFAWLAVIGGLPALPWIDDLIELIESWTGIPIRIQVRQHIEKLAGSTAANFAGAGMFGLMDMDLSAAIRPAGVPFVGQVSQSIFGVYAGMAQKVGKAYAESKLGEWARVAEHLSPAALENLLKGYRLANEGATTTAKNPIYGPSGKLLKLNAAGELSQMLGVKNLQYSNVLQDNWEKQVIEKFYNDRKSNLVKKWHLAKTPLAKTEVRLEMREFNRAIPKYLRGIISEAKTVPLQPPDKKMEKLRRAMSRE